MSWPVSGAVRCLFCGDPGARLVVGPPTRALAFWSTSEHVAMSDQTFAESRSCEQHQSIVIWHEQRRRWPDAFRQWAADR